MLQSAGEVSTAVVVIPHQDYSFGLIFLDSGPNMRRVNVPIQDLQELCLKNKNRFVQETFFHLTRQPYKNISETKCLLKFVKIPDFLIYIGEYLIK